MATRNKLKSYNPIIGIAILVVLALLVAWYVRRPSPTDTVQDAALVNHDAATVPSPTTGEPVPRPKNTIEVSDQAADTIVDIDAVSLQSPGFVVIRDDNGGQPGKVVAKSNLIAAGSRQDLIINLTTKAGATYYAQVYTDNGDRVFNETKDTLLNTPEAAPLMAQFMIVK